MEILRGYSKSYLTLLFATCAAFLIGAYARFKGIGTWPLAIDEYYLTQSILHVVESGLPIFDCGGVYNRGVLQQYLTAPLIYFGLPTEFSARLITAISSIATIPALYLLGKSTVSRQLGWVLVLFFSLSLWQVEFARFARMYAPFQCLIVWQLYFLHSVLNDDNATSKRHWILAGLGLLAIFTYEGAIFAIFLATVPVILQRVRLISFYTVFVLATILIAGLAQVTDWRHMGAIWHLPADVNEADLIIESALPIAVPTIAFLKVPHWTLWLGAALSLVGGIFTLTKTRFYADKKIQIYLLIPLALSLLCAICHQMLLAWYFLLAAFILTGYKSQFDLKRFLPWSFFLTIASVMWLGLMLMQDDLSRYQLFDGQGHARLAIQAVFLFPDIYTRIIGQWFESIPVHTMIIFVGVGMSFLATMFGQARSRFEPLVLLILITLIIGNSALETQYLTPRYSFFIYPMLLLSAACGFAHVIFVSPGRLRSITAAAFIGAILFASDDFAFKHLLEIDSYDTNFRTTMPSEKAELYYDRIDFQSPALFINSQLSDGDEVLTFYPVIHKYLDRTDEHFVSVLSEKFAIISACEGKRELWSHTPLMYRQDQLDAWLSKQTSWAIVRANQPTYVEEQALWDKYKSFMVFDGGEKGLQVLKIPARNLD